MTTPVDGSGASPLQPTPAVADGFTWVDHAAGRVLIADALSPYARHAFTTRRFGTSGEAADNVTALAHLLGVDRAALARVRQVHGCDVLSVSREHPCAPGHAADALVSTDPSQPVAVAVADCVPILIADRRQRAVSAVHAGWRGTASRIVVAAVQALARAGVPPADLVVAIGPSIGPCCYQVDRPVYDAFQTASVQAASWFSPDGSGRWRLDLWRANADQLADAGVRRDAIHVAAFCTADHLEDCFSFRREGAAAGRMFGAIRLLPAS